MQHDDAGLFRFSDALRIRTGVQEKGREGRSRGRGGDEERHPGRRRQIVEAGAEELLQVRGKGKKLAGFVRLWTGPSRCPISSANSGFPPEVS